MYSEYWALGAEPIKPWLALFMSLDWIHLADNSQLGLQRSGEASVRAGNQFVCGNELARYLFILLCTTGMEGQGTHGWSALRMSERE